MATKKKRLLSLLLAAAVAAVVPAEALRVYATEEASVSESGETADESGESESSEDEDGETVLEDGEVVMEGAVGKIDESEWITMDDYTRIAENDSYIMYFYEPRLSFILESKTTGAILESTLSDEKDDGNSNTSWNAYMKSGVVATAIIGTNNTYQVDLITCENTIDVEYLDNGFSADIWFTEYQFGFTVSVTLEDEDVVITVPDDSIVENKEDTYISTISLYPFFGYTFMDDQDGYMLIPDGNGALIYLDNKEGRYTTGFSQMIYGSDDGFVSSTTTSYLWDKYETVVDTGQVIAPVFGMAHLDDGIGYIAVVEDGEMRASIEVQPNGAMVNYNRCFAKFLLRDVYTQPLNQSNSGTVLMAETDRTHSDLTVRYMLLEEYDADYSGMAVRYRSYLLENELLVQQDTSYNTRVDFLGTDREEFLLSTRAVTMTTTENIEEIYADLQDAGVTSLLSVYKGWQKGGVFSLPIKTYKADSNIGGTAALTSLIEEAAEEGYQLYLYNDALEINGTTNTTTFNAVKMVNKRTLTVETTQQVYDTFYYLIPSKTESILEKFVSSYTKKGVNNLAVAGISNTLFSYSQKGSYYSRYDTAEYYEETIAEIGESTDLILEQPFSYLWKYTEAFLDMPLGSSNYMYADEEIPFLSMVLKGSIPMYSDYVNFEANKQEFFLQMVESGVYPSFYVTYENASKLIYTNSSDMYSTEYSTYRDTIIQYDEELRAVAEAVQDSYIMEHEKLDNGVTKVTYDNGVVIYVNYSDEDASVDGYTIGAMSYKVGDAK